LGNLFISHHWLNVLVVVAWSTVRLLGYFTHLLTSLVPHFWRQKSCERGEMVGPYKRNFIWSASNIRPLFPRLELGFLSGHFFAHNNRGFDNNVCLVALRR
jgi:hypothetical protein